MTHRTRRHDDFTTTVDAAAAHAALHGDPWDDTDPDHDPRDNPAQDAIDRAILNTQRALEQPGGRP